MRIGGQWGFRGGTAIGDFGVWNYVWQAAGRWGWIRLMDDGDTVSAGLWAEVVGDGIRDWLDDGMGITSIYSIDKQNNNWIRTKSQSVWET